MRISAILDFSPAESMARLVLRGLFFRLGAYDSALEVVLAEIADVRHGAQLTVHRTGYQALRGNSDVDATLEQAAAGGDLKSLLIHLREGYRGVRLELSSRTPKKKAASVLFLDDRRSWVIEWPIDSLQDLAVECQGLTLALHAVGVALRGGRVILPL